MSRTRVHNLMVSLDGYAAGEYVTMEEPIGAAARLFGWFDGRVIDGIDRIADPVTLDRALISMWGQGIGAEIMGRRKFGPQVGEWPDDGWRGWWGDDPPFRIPVFVLSHHPHAPIDFPNGTTSWTPRPRRRCAWLGRPRRAVTCASAEGRPRCGSSSAPI